MLAGFAGILTPCVFPMIPMTVAFFSQGAEKKGSAIGKALIFGLTIILLYSSLGIIVSLDKCRRRFCQYPQHALDTQPFVLCTLPCFCRIVLRCF